MDLQKKTPGHVSIGVKIKRAVWNVMAALFFRPFITGVFRIWRIALLKLFAIGLLLAAVSSLSAVISILRYDPLRILSERD